jgi:hypothetical protein
VTEAENSPNTNSAWGAPAGGSPGGQPSSRFPAPGPEGPDRFAPNAAEGNGRDPKASPYPPFTTGGGRSNGNRSRGTGRYGRGTDGDQHGSGRSPTGARQPTSNGHRPTYPGMYRATTTALGVPGPLAGTPARVDGRATGTVPGPPPVPLIRPQRTPVRRVAAPPIPGQIKARRVRLIEKFGGRRLRHHASLWRRTRSLVGILLIGIVLASILAAIVALIVGTIALAIQHALHG